MKPIGPVERAVRLPLQRAWWSFLRMFYPPRLVRRGGLRVHVMDARPPRDRVAAPCTDLVEDALERISTAGQGLGELVPDHIQLIAFMDVKTDFALPYLKTYVTPLKPTVKLSGHMIACQL